MKPEEILTRALERLSRPKDCALSLRVPAELRARLEAVAEEQGVSLNALATSILEVVLGDEEGT